MRKLIKMTVALAAAISVLLTLSCELMPFGADDDGISEQYQFAAEVLDAFFIFQERLPSDLYGFSSPQALYEYVDEPYTAFYSSDIADLIRKSLSTESEAGGIGIMADSVYNGFAIKDVFPQSPGQKAGLQRRDTIVEINNKSIAGRPWRGYIDTLIGGDIGKKVTLGVKRADSTLEISVTLGLFKSPTVFVDTLDSSIAYISLSTFLSETSVPGGSAEEFRNALIETEWAEHTILDLRGNPGGMINQCFEITGELVEPGSPIILSHERRMDNAYYVYGIDTTYTSSGTGSAAGRNLTILANRNSVSASELLISCVKSNRPEVTLIGDTTYGKARMQVWLDGPDEVMAIVTCGLFTPVNMDPYDMVGIIPDVTVEPDQDALDVAAGRIEGALARRLSRTGNYGKLFTDGKQKSSFPSGIILR